MARRRSAGLLLYRRTERGWEVLLAHPGGPFWAGRDAGAWMLPKGEIDPDEDPLAAALREFEEEIGAPPRPAAGAQPQPLGEIRQSGGKRVLIWALEGEPDAARGRAPARTRLEWPRGSGRTIEFPEVDRWAWFPFEEAWRRILPSQRPALERLAERLGERPPPADSTGR